jgi:hypothetical protein
MNGEGITYALITQALKVALIVGTILVLINQYDALFGSQSFRWLPAILTYSVPFCVFLAGRASGSQR